MAYSNSTKEQAKTLYLVEGKKIEEISNILNIPLKTVYAWKQKGGWDKILKSSGTLGIALDMQKQFYEEVQIAIANKNLTNPAVADALYKTASMMEKLLPKKMMLANIFNLVEDITHCAKTKIGDDKFTNMWGKYLPEIAEYLRRKYND